MLNGTPEYSYKPPELNFICSLREVASYPTLAKDVDHIAWAQEDLDEIINQCDNLVSLIDEVKKATEQK